MSEYQLHTQGAAHNYTPPFDGRDPMRNRHIGNIPIPGVKRYTLGCLLKHNVGRPDMVESPHGEYVSYSDYRALELHNEMQLLLRKGVDEQLAYALATIESMKARSAV